MLRRGLQLVCVVPIVASLGAFGMRWHVERTTDDGSQVVKTKETQDIKESVRALKSTYPDVIGWIQIDDLGLSFPVVQGENNDFYLHHNYKGEAHDFGAIFLDAANQDNWQDQNSVVYGHNITTGKFFHSLMKLYHNQEAIGVPIIVATPNETITYHVAGVFRVDPYLDYRKPSYQGADWANYLLRMDAVDGTKPFALEEKDHLLTLSTCFNDNERLVVVAKRQ